MLLIFSESIINSKAANTIQTKATALELSEHTRVLTFFRSDNATIKTERVSDNLRYFIIFGPKNLLGSIFYLLFSSLFITFFSIRHIFSNETLRFYGRNIYISFIASLHNIPGAFELHDIPNRIQKYLLNLSLRHKNISLIVITNSLKDDIDRALNNKFSKKIYTIADSHNFLFNDDDLKKKQIKNIEKFKIGYFGSLHTYKGSDLLFETARELNYEVDIFTKDLDRIPEDILSNCNCAYIPHKEVQNLMYQYDVCFLFLENTNEFDDISMYTSPLKLFEYMAAGVVTICSDHFVLKEVVSEQEVEFVKNNTSSVINSINRLNENKSLFKLKQKNSIKKSFKYTYEERADMIFKILMKSSA